MTAPGKSGRGWAYTGAVLGGAVSIAANVAHSFIPPIDAPQGWEPEAGAVVGAIVWPVFLFVAVEILARVAWPYGRTWQAVRWAGILPVAVVAALVSYRHLSGLLDHYGEEPVVSILGPLAVDGLMVMATGALIATGRHRTTSESVTIPADAAPGGDPALTTSTVTDPPAVPDMPSRADEPSRVDVPSSAGDRPTVSPLPVPDPGPDTPAEQPARPEVSTPAVVAARLNPPRTDAPAVPAAAARGATARPTARPRPHQPGTPAPALAPSTTDTSVAESDAAQPAPPAVPGPLLAKAREVARQYRTEHGTPITAGKLAVRLRVTSEQASQALAVLALGSDSPTMPVPTVNGNRPKAAR
jgi:hypothetical protein